MKISKVEFWNSHMLWTIVLKTILKISRHAENHVKNFKARWNIVFKMHYRFQHVLKFSFQHALQISTCITDFNMCWNFQNAFSRCFQHISNIKIHLWYEPYWKLCWKPCQIFQSVLKTMLKISRLGSYCRKRHDMTVTWPFENIVHRTNTVKI